MVIALFYNIHLIYLIYKDLRTNIIISEFVQRITFEEVKLKH